MPIIDSQMQKINSQIAKLTLTCPKSIPWGLRPLIFQQKRRKSAPSFCELWRSKWDKVIIWKRSINVLLPDLVSLLLFFKNMVINHPHSKYFKYKIHFTPVAQKIGSQWLRGVICVIQTEKHSHSTFAFVVSNEVSDFRGFNHVFLWKKGVTHTNFVVPVLRGVIYVIYLDTKTVPCANRRADTAKSNP